MATDRLPWLLLMIALAALAWTWIGASGSVAEARAVAALHVEIADSANARARADSTANAALRDSLARKDSALADSSAVWAERARENALTVARLTDRANDARSALEASLDGVGGALLAEYTAATDSVIALRDEQIADLTAERALLWARMETADELVAGLTTELEAVRMVARAQERAIESLRNGLNASSRQNTLLKAGGALLVGLAVYDRVSGS